MFFQTIRLLPVLLTLAMVLISPQQTHAADLTVRVLGVHSSRGNVRASLCTEPHFTREGCEYDATVAAHEGLTILTFHNVPPGHYAVQFFHDEDGDGQFKTTRLGIPDEGFGFSRDAPTLGRPRFDDAAIDLSTDGANILTTMRYSLF